MSSHSNARVHRSNDRNSSHHVFSGRDGCDIIFFVRTATTKEKYVQQTHNILNTWGRHAEGRLVFLSDNANPAAIDHFRDNYPNLAMFLVEGAELVKYYYLKNRTIADLIQGWRGTRLEIRALFSIFVNNVRNDRFRWMCLTNADMYINVPRLTKELQDIVANPPRSCARADRCAVANVLEFTAPRFSRPSRYFAGGFCMRTETVFAIYNLMMQYTDLQMGWCCSEDFHFSHALHMQLGLELTDSLQMLDSYGNYYVPPGTNFSRPYKPTKLSIQHPLFAKKKLKMPVEFLLNTTIIHPRHIRQAMKRKYRYKYLTEDNASLVWHKFVESFRDDTEVVACPANLSETFKQVNTSGGFVVDYALDKDVIEANEYYMLE